MPLDLIGKRCVIDLTTGESTGEVLEWVKPGAAGWKEGSTTAGIPRLKARPTARRTPSGVYFHKVGTPSRKMNWSFGNDDEPNRYHFAGATEDGKYVVLNTSTGTDGSSLACHVAEEDGDWNAHCRRLHADHSSMVEHVNGKLYMLTDIDAPRYRLVAADPAGSIQQDALARHSSRVGRPALES